MKSVIEQIAQKHDVELCGFTRVEDIKLAHPPRRAADLLPGAASTISLGAALLRGAVQSPAGTKGAVKDAQLATERLEGAAAAIGRYLEGQGHLAYVPPASMPVDLVKTKGGAYYVAEWSHRQAAIAARVGVLGLNNLLITPEYGPYVRLASVITTAALEPSERTLDEDLCSGCLQCVAACPADALSSTSADEPAFDQLACRGHYIRPFHPSLWQSLKGAFGTDGFGTLAVQVLLEGYYFACAECVRACPAGELADRFEPS